MRRLLLSLIVAASLAPAMLLSQSAEHLIFQHFSLKEGLSHTTIYDIAQGKDGQMWFATGYGLNRYNGSKFILYRNIRGDSTSIFENFTRSLLVDSGGMIWVGTQRGISRFDRTKERFLNYPYDEDGAVLNVLSIVEYKKETYLLGTNLGLYSFSEKSGYTKLSSPANVRITTIIKFKDRYLLGSDAGLFEYILSDNSYVTIDSKLLDKVVMALVPHCEDKNKVWIGTEGDGLYLFDMSDKKLRIYKQNLNQKSSISSNYIRGIAYDSQNRLWVGTFMGLNILDRQQDGFDHYFHDQYNNQTLSQSSIRTIFLDNQGGMWAGSYFGGINYYHPQKSRFTNYVHQPDKNSLSCDIVSVMLADDKNNIWIGTNDKGVDYFEVDKGIFHHFTHDPNNSKSISGNNVKTLLPIENNDMYVGSHGGGLCLFNSKTKTFRRIYFADSYIYNDAVYSLVKGDGDIMWIGTLYGLFKYDRKKETSILINESSNGIKLPNTQIMALLRDSKKRLWVGTENGINRYNDKTGLYEMKPSPITNERSSCCFFEDSKSRIWAGTRSGLLLYDESLSDFVDMTQSIGFPDLVIFGILEDDYGKLWLSSSNGLIRLDPQNNTWFTYNQEDGIANRLFSFYSFCKSGDGRLYFGGVNGITALYPDEVFDNTFTPNAIIDKLTLFNKMVRPGDNTGILSQSISLTDKIRLKPKQSTFGFEFSVPNYLSANNNLFEYMLEGYDTEWRRTSVGEAEYSNLKPGRYTFLLKAANNNRLWSKQTVRLSITILPYWWETWWAMCIFVVTCVVIIIAAINYYSGRKLLKGELALERVEKQRIERMNEAKIKFFINISHEFRTPLTLIISPLFEIFEKGVNDKWLGERLTLIMRNAKRMMHLTNQVLDYRRTETGTLNLKVQRRGVYSHTHEIFMLFRHMMETKGIHYRFSCNTSSEKLYFDANFIEHILTNLINNAYKYTPPAGTIEVNISDDEQNLILEVADTGCGIPEDKQEAIFERFYQLDDSVNGTGIGLSLVKNLVELNHGSISLKSKPNQGSTFIVKLPCTVDALLPSEVDNCDVEVASEQFTMVDDELSDNTRSTENSKKILLVEDDKEIASYLKDNLSKYYDIAEAENGQQALSILKDDPEIDLVISDVMMPVMDGIKLCHHIKQNIAFSHIPVVMLTAKAEFEAQLDGINAGADDYICKPFIFSILSAKISNIFKSRELLYQRYISAQDNDISKLTTNSIDREFMEKTIKIIEENMSNPAFSSEDLSRELGMCRSNLYIKLKAITNESAILFMRRVRLNHACKLLREGRYNMAEISTIIGFTPAYFTTSFRKYMGCSPSEYIKENRN